MEAAPLSDLATWARGDGIEILLLATGAVLVARAVGWAGTLATGRIDARVTRSDALVRSESDKHRHALVQVATWATLVLVYGVAALLVVQRLGLPLAGLVAPATVAGVALGFGAQRVVQDLLAGFFIVTERQYGYGDVIRVSVAGGLPLMTGTVEEVSLRVTRIRTMDGEVVITPNGQIVQVTNLSRDWARAVIDVPVPVGSDVNAVTRTLQDVGAEAFEDGRLGSLLLDRPSVMGVEAMEVDQLRVRIVARTLPGKQFDVAWQLRGRAAAALRAKGLHVPPLLATAEPSGA